MVGIMPNEVEVLKVMSVLGGIWGSDDVVRGPEKKR